ncbi:hypothetical protein IC762_30495 [Bradyrhizobium genosp. L]|uniref:hypothetical protein n=1 Tax=Bradyrhizobium genosp. L TaxID=83637 RepID=UPI0018A266F2|nr:hypothetical protein [Bradyrhizobium genosp. L]QPF83938.1 hypothetical protein IC762_30495 [Bradyrhizobium genosp. L]
MNAAFKKQWAAADAASDAEQDADDIKTKIPARKTGGDAADSYDRAKESLEKYTARLTAEANAQGQGAAATEEAKANAQLLTAAQQAGIPVTQKVLDQMQDLAQDAAEAADALAKAKVASDISRGQQTALLTPQDLAIANQLKGIYGDDIPAALRSSEAASLRFNSTIQQLGQLGQQVNSGFLVDFEPQIRNGASAMDALKTAGVSALGKIADKLAQMAADNLWSSAFGGTSGGGLLGLLGVGGSPASNTSAINASNATLASGTGGAFYGPGFASGTDNAPGGMSLVGENGPEILNIPKGAQVIPNDILRNGGGGGVNVNAGSTVVIQGDASDKTVALIKAALAQHDATLPGRIVSTVRDAKARRVLA